ncbi:MAG: uridine kinase [Planctomycetota bacterium]
MKPIVIGIAGGSASGKTLFARRLLDNLHAEAAAILELDGYYHDLAGLSFEERKEVNFDHPRALDIDLLVEHLETLLRQEPVETPIYDYVNHTRRPETSPVPSRPIVIVEGILVFHFERLRDLMDIRIFVETASDVRLLRRIRRDILKRGRALDDVLEQYETDVRPMHEAFVEPSKIHADLVIPRGGENHVAVDVLRSKIAQLALARGIGGEA